jgi:hypothetical protein
MKYLLVSDKALRNQLIGSGCRLLSTRKSLDQSEIYTFEFNEKIPLCFNILQDASFRQKCTVTDRLSMTF